MLGEVVEAVLKAAEQDDGNVFKAVGREGGGQVELFFKEDDLAGMLQLGLGTQDEVGAVGPDIAQKNLQAGRLMKV